MAKTAPLGYMACPDCDFPDAEIKIAKNGWAYRFCPECYLQTFTRKQAEHDRMIAKMRPANPATVTEPAAASPGNETGQNDRIETKPAEQPKPQPKPKSSGFSLGEL